MTLPANLSERRVLIWMCVLIAINQLGFGAIVPTISLYAKSFGVSTFLIGMAIAIYGFARLFGAPCAGMLSDRLGRRPSLALGGLVTALGNVICAVADSYPEFMLGRFVAGAGAGLVITTGQIILADITTPARRGRVISIYQGTFIFAVGVGPLPGGLIADNFGLYAPFAVYGVAGVVCALCAWFAVGETRDFAANRDGKPAPDRVPFMQQLRILAAKRGYVLICIVSLMNAVVRTGGLFSLIPLIGAVKLGLSLSEVGFGLALGSGLGLLAAYPAGALADRYGRKMVIVPTTIITGVSMCLFAFSGGYPLFLAACVVWGVASAIGGAAPSAYAADNAPPGMNAATMSTFRMVGDVGYVVGPLSLGLIADYAGTDIALLVAACGIMLAGMVFAVGAQETWRAPVSETVKSR